VTYLIWSNQHGMWWRAHRRGYTPFIEEAGRYNRKQADEIIHSATVGGQLGINRTDPVTGREYRQFTEVIVTAPEVAAERTDGKPGDVRFGLAVDSDNGAHVRFRLFAATIGQHLGSCGGQLVMRSAEYAAFRSILEKDLASRADVADPEAVRCEDGTSADSELTYQSFEVRVAASGTGDLLQFAYEGALSMLRGSGWEIQPDSVQCAPVDPRDGDDLISFMWTVARPATADGSAGAQSGPSRSDAKGN
jgi:hypothetical protein